MPLRLVLLALTTLSALSTLLAPAAAQAQLIGGWGDPLLVEDRATSAALWEQPPLLTEPPLLTDPPPRFTSPNSPSPRRVVRGQRTQFLAGDSPLERLASTPHMFGDFVSLAGQVRVQDFGRADVSQLDLPLAGGTRRLKVAENNLPLPMDRVFYTYSHFHNAVTAESGDLLTAETRSFPIDRHIVGFEKTFLDGWASFEVRMPFTGGVDASAPGGLSARTGSVGNVTLVTKALLAVGENTAFAAGLGVELPTGDDVDGADSMVRYRVSNDAVHLLPYVAALWTPGDMFFCQAYAQFDAAANGNRIFIGAGDLAPQGMLMEQNLIHLDVAGGLWLYSDLDAPLLTGLAAIAELHYVTTVTPSSGQPDRVVYEGMNQRWEFGNQYGNLDLLHLTAGLHAEFARRTTLRVGAVAPLRPAPDRFFDSEVQVSVNRFW